MPQEPGTRGEQYRPALSIVTTPLPAIHSTIHVAHMLRQHRTWSRAGEGCRANPERLCQFRTKETRIGACRRHSSGVGVRGQPVMALYAVLGVDVPRESLNLRSSYCIGVTKPSATHNRQHKAGLLGNGLVMCAILFPLRPKRLFAAIWSPHTVRRRPQRTCFCNSAANDPVCLVHQVA